MITVRSNEKAGGAGHGVPLSVILQTVMIPAGRWMVD